LKGILSAFIHQNPRHLRAKNQKNINQKIKKMKKSKTFLFGSLAAIAILLSACCKDDDRCCKDNTLTKKTIPITSNILGVIIEGPWEVSITQDSAKNDAMIEYPACAENKITAELRSNGYLFIRVRNAHYHNHSYSATINAIALEKIDASGAVAIRTYGNFYSSSEITLSGASSVNGFWCEGDDVEITLSGASVIKNFSFYGRKMDADLSGASNLSLKDVTLEKGKINCSGSSKFEGNGTISETTFTGSGASLFKTLKIETENLDVDFSGASKGEITVSNSIKGRLSGASILEYREADGSVNVNVSTTGGSQVIRLN
jgi:hypothetical protein